MRIVGWSQLFVEESPDSKEKWCQLTAGRGNSRESATENIPPQVGKGEMVR